MGDVVVKVEKVETSATFGEISVGFPEEFQWKTDLARGETIHT